MRAISASVLVFLSSMIVVDASFGRVAHPLFFFFCRRVAHPSPFFLSFTIQRVPHLFAEKRGVAFCASEQKVGL